MSGLDAEEAKKAKARARAKAWYAENKGRAKASAAARYTKNAEAICQRVRARYAATKPALLPKPPRRIEMIGAQEERRLLAERQRAYRAAAPEKYREYKRQWKQGNADKVQAQRENRRAAKRSSPGVLSRDIVKTLLLHQRGKCACCRAALAQSGHHLDHIVPLALSGHNTDDNVQLLCPQCNLSKSAKHPVDFMQERGFLL